MYIINILPSFTHSFTTYCDVGHISTCRLGFQSTQPLLKAPSGDLCRSTCRWKAIGVTLPPWTFRGYSKQPRLCRRPWKPQKADQG